MAPQALCVCVAAACGASATSNKNTPLDFVSMYLVDFVIFNDFRAPPSPVRLCRSCLRRFGDLRKNTPLCWGNMYFVDVVIFK